MQPFFLIEPLENRIAPATIINPHTLTYQDVDGDSVVVKISKPLFQNPQVANAIFQFTNVLGVGITDAVNGSNNTPEALNTIDLRNLENMAVAQGMNISVTVQQKLGVGNGEANVGQILAATLDPETLQFSQNIDLGVIRIQGNLGKIDVGDKFPTQALRVLDVDSMNQELLSNILGPIGNFHIRGDLADARIKVYGSEFGNINRLTIDGALRGGADDTSGQIFVTGTLRNATIGSIVGGAGAFSGSLVGTLFRDSAITNLHVLGSVTAGNFTDAAQGADSANVFFKRVGNVRIDGDLVGGSGSQSGVVFGEGSVGAVSVGGSVKGGTGSRSGFVTSNATMGSAVVGGDLIGGAGDNSGKISAPNSVRRVQIGGSVLGGSAVESGEIFSSALGFVRIGQNLVGGSAGTDASAGFSGVIRATNAVSINVGGSVIGGTVADTAHTGNTSGAIIVIPPIDHPVNSVLRSLNIGGDLQGSAANNSGEIFGSQLLNINIGGNVQGGAGSNSGLISAITPLISADFLHLIPGTIGTLHVGGSVLGGAGNSSGKIIAAGALKNATIDGDLTGGQVNQSAVLFESGYIEAGHISQLTIGGDVTAGLNSSATGKTASSGAIRSTADIAKLVIKGNLQGSANAQQTISNNAIISAVGQQNLSAKATANIAIGSLSVGGNVTRAEILAGYDPNTVTGSGANQNLAGNPRGVAVNADAQINSITIGNTLSASSIVAGATPGTDPFFGDANDTKPSGQGVVTESTNPSVLSRILSLVIGTSATGSANGAEHFGIVAQNIASITIAGNPVSLTSGPSNDNVQISSNLRAVEIASP